MGSEAVMEFLGDVSVLQRLPSSSIIKIAHHLILKHYNSGEYVFREGEPGGGIYFIYEGEVEVSCRFHADHHDSQVSPWKKFDHFTQSESDGQEDVIALTKLTCLLLPHEFSHLMHPKSIWNEDMNLETIAPVEHILALDPLDVNTFRGITLNGAPKSAKVYGGQFMGQALAAASKTVHFLKILHSFHAHFLLAGDVNIPVIYQVDRLRDVSNLATRRVNAVQNDRIVFFLIASFHSKEEGFDHQEPIMPSLPDPETLLSKHGLEEGVKLPRHHPTTKVSTSTYVPWPTEIRPVDPENYTRHTTRSPSIRYWLRAKGRLPDDQVLHSSLLHPKSIWSADMNLETIAPVEHILSLDPLDVNTFRGITLHGAPKSAKVYGGQFMGQALAAASKTVHFLKILHSFHAHFLLPGNLNIPIRYQVDRLCDVSTLATRRVNAVQNDRIVFVLIASFHSKEEGFDHQEPTMPSMPEPEMLLSKHGLEEGVVLPHHIPRIEVSTSTSVPWPTEIRPFDPETYSRHTTRPPSVSYWLRAKGILPDDQALHRCVGAYFSDLLFLQISLNPHRKEGVFPSCISLDHSMWFHRDFRADDWLLYVIDSPTAYNARGFSRGQMFNRKGELWIKNWCFQLSKTKKRAQLGSNR